MKILLFNDNPVVRKLVALSAQKTKDDLNVVWSADEIEGSEYDLLIVDDALYSDEMFESLDERIRVKSKLLMATRGNSVPSGFDNVINKPFLPTDLVDMLVQIDKKVAGMSNQKENEAEDTPVYSINLEDSLPEIEHQENKSLNLEELDSEEDEFDFGSLEDFDEKLPETGILDHEEVQEVQGLLEDTEEEATDNEENIIVQGIDELDFLEDESETAAPIVELPTEIADEDAFDEVPIPDEIEGELLNFDDVLNDAELKLEDETPNKELLDEDDFGDLEFPPILDEEEEKEGVVSEEEVSEMEEDFGFDDVGTLDESGLEDLDISNLMNDEELNNLESKIEDAVSGLESDDLERELASDDFGVDIDDDLMEELTIEPAVSEEKVEVQKSESNGLDELDMLDERELKLAIGEAVDEDDFYETDADTMTLNTEELDEMMDESEIFEEVGKEVSDTEPSAAHTEGVEALQALLKALSNEDVARSLKGMNISININFGNEK